MFCTEVNDCVLTRNENCLTACSWRKPIRQYTFEQNQEVIL